MRTSPSYQKSAPGGLTPLVAALAEALLLLVAVEAVLLAAPVLARWGDFVRTVHLRALTPLLAAAWLFLLWQGRRAGVTAGAPRLFALALAAVAATTALSTALSVAPEASLWGDVRLTTGLLSVLSWVVIAGTAATVLRTWQQVERLLRAVLLAAFAAAWYGLILALGWDTLSPLLVETTRDGSTFGNPVYFGSLLALALPLGLAWLALALRPVDDAPAPPGARRPARVARARATAGRRPPWGGWLLAAGGAQALYALWLVIARHRPDAGWFLPPLLVVFAWLASAAPPWPAAPSGQPWPAKALAALVVLVLGLALVVIGARGPLLGAATGLALGAIWLLRPRWRRPALLLVPTLGLVATLSAVTLLPALGRALPPALVASPLVARLTSIESRQEMWEISVRLLTAPPAVVDDRPLGAPLRLAVGYGPDTQRFVFEPAFTPTLRNLEGDRVVSSVHNELLDRVLAVGLVGAAAWLLLLVAAAIAARAAYQRADARQRILLGGIIAALIAYGVEQLTGPAYPPVRTLAWLLLGALAGLAAGAGEAEPIASPASAGWPLGLAAATLAVALALPAPALHEVGASMTGWWAWSLVALLALAWALAPPAVRRLRGAVVVSAALFVAGGLLVGSQALRPLVAERLDNAAVQAFEQRNLPLAVGLAADARAAWPFDARYDARLGVALADLAGAQLQQAGRPPGRLPQPTPLPAAFGPEHVARATPEQLLDWATWLLTRATERQPLDVEHHLARGALYAGLGEQLQDPAAWAEAQRSARRASALSPTLERANALRRRTERL
jgi:hypothetical protein